MFLRCCRRCCFSSFFIVVRLVSLFHVKRVQEVVQVKNILGRRRCSLPAVYGQCELWPSQDDGLEFHKGGDVHFVSEGFSSVESLVDEFDEEVHVDLFGIELLDQVESGLHGASRGEQVIMQEHHVV